MSERELFLAALDIGDPVLRAGYLETTCPDSAQRARVDALILAHDTAGSFLGKPLVEAGSAAGDATLEVPARKPEAPGEEDGLAFLAPPTQEDSLGRLGHYEVLEILGRGGFGIVFRAFDDRLQRVVAVKVLSPQMAVTSPARKRFLREAQSFARIRHENVVQVYQVEEQPLPYLVMEFIPGETLQERLDNTTVADLKPLAGVPLKHLNCAHTKVGDLAPLKGKNLISLYIDGTKVTDLSPLKGMPLKIFNCRDCKFQPKRDGEILRSLTALEEINSKPVAEFLKELGGE